MLDNDQTSLFFQISRAFYSQLSFAVEFLPSATNSHPLQYFAINLVFLQQNPPPQNSWSMFLRSCSSISNCHKLVIQRLSLAFIRKYLVYYPKPILSTLSNPTRWNPNSALATEFAQPAKDKKEVYSINGGNIRSWQESLQRRGYNSYWASRFGFVWGWPYLQGIFRTSRLHEFLSKNLGVQSASHQGLCFTFWWNKNKGGRSWICCHSPDYINYYQNHLYKHGMV